MRYADKQLRINNSQISILQIEISQISILQIMQYQFRKNEYIKKIIKIKKDFGKKRRIF